MSYSGKITALVRCNHAPNHNVLQQGLKAALENLAGADARSCANAGPVEDGLCRVVVPRVVLADIDAFETAARRFAEQLEARGLYVERVELSKVLLLEPPLLPRGVDYDENTGVLRLRADSDVLEWVRIGGRVLLTSGRRGDIVEFGLPFVIEVIDERPPTQRAC